MLNRPFFFQRIVLNRIVLNHGGFYMRKALTSVVIITFAGVLCMSLLAVFNGSMTLGPSAMSHLYDHLYFIAY